MKIFINFINRIKNLRNFIDFKLRNTLKINRPLKKIKNELKYNLFIFDSDEKNIKARKKEKLYLNKYKLDLLKNNSSKQLYKDNLSIIELLEIYFPLSKESNNLKILDVGSKNWFYASALHSFFKYNNHSSRNIELKGIEIDAYRMYTNFHTRYDYAKYFIKDLENTAYITGDVLKHIEKYDCITIFFPFLSPCPLLAWGLPLNLLLPEKIIKHCFNLLNINGKILIVNHSIEERNTLEKILKANKISYEIKSEHKSSFLDYKKPRLITIIKKLAS